MKEYSVTCMMVSSSIANDSTVKHAIIISELIYNISNSLRDYVLLRRNPVKIITNRGISI